jgi:hypothetical protein
VLRRLDRRGCAGDPIKPVGGDDCEILNMDSEGSKELRLEKDNGFTGFAALKAELPRYDDGGGPAGVKDRVDDGGGPAGVVEGFEAPKEKMLLPWPDRLSGVDGAGLEEKGTS